MQLEAALIRTKVEVQTKWLRWREPSAVVRSSNSFLAAAPSHLSASWPDRTSRALEKGLPKNQSELFLLFKLQQCLYQFSSSATIALLHLR